MNGDSPPQGLVADSLCYSTVLAEPYDLPRCNYHIDQIFPFKAFGAAALAAEQGFAGQTFASCSALIIPVLAQVCRFGQEDPGTAAGGDSFCIAQSPVAWLTEWTYFIKHCLHHLFHPN